jgi:hypothetical protein
MLLYTYVQQQRDSTMSKWFYHGTTLEGYHAIQKAGFIMPRSGKTYTNQIFLCDNDAYARRVTFIKHAQEQGEVIVVYKIHKNNLRRKLLKDGSKHISNMLSFGDKTWCYSAPIDISSDTVLVGAAPYFINLPHGVSIVRDGSSTGLSLSQAAAKEYLGI